MASVYDSYWFVGDDQANVWGSRLQTVVPIDDGDYDLWKSAGNVTMTTPSYSTLYGYLLSAAPDLAETVKSDFAADLSPQQIFDIAIANGCQVESTGTPSINGTYAIDQASLLNVIALALGIVAGDDFPGGATTYDYPDITGNMVTFSSTTLFLDFALALRDYVAALIHTFNVLQNSGSATWPTLPMTIA